MSSIRLSLSCLTRFASLRILGPSGGRCYPAGYSLDARSRPDLQENDNYLKLLRARDETSGEAIEESSVRCRSFNRRRPSFLPNRGAGMSFLGSDQARKCLPIDPQRLRGARLVATQLLQDALGIAAVYLLPPPAGPGGRGGRRAAGQD